MGFFDKLKKINIFASFGSELTDDFYDELEESLILADTGMDTTLELVEELRRRVREPLERLAAGLKAGETARDYVEALYGFMEELKLETALTERMHAQAEAGRMQEAEETAQLWEILCGVLDQFVEILGEEHLEQSEFERLFRLVLTQYSVGTIPVALDQVSVSEITRNDRHTTSYLFLLGANDHVLPDPGQSGGLLNEDDRQALALRGVELAPTGIRVNCVAPGVIQTDMLSALPPEVLPQLARETPLGRLGTPEDIAAAVSFLASGKASFITGQVLTADGGFIL